MNLNLARKWRSKNFDQLIGQNMSVRMLKNSLYLNQFFPVYLFSGQHGCGKTSTARIFAAAVNCAALPQFRTKPREYSVPCQTCDSCVAFAQGRHPDFYEIDAASHTGVDTIRQIIEAATLLPVMGNKKIYLIDEAHMLSKAAFNALLKILEEPPTAVLFILATTDEQKILETVQSRCFKLFFSPVKHATLVEHLAAVCSQENIPYQQQALSLIAEESNGSVRDALNLIEQIRFSSSSITHDSVMRILGRVDDTTLIRMMEFLCTGQANSLLATLQATQWHQYKADALWHRLLLLVRAILWVKYGAPLEHFHNQKELLTSIAQKCSVPFLHKIMHTLHANEQLFMRTMHQHELLELLLLQLCHKKGNNEGGSGASPSTVMPAPSSRSEDEDTTQEHDDSEVEEDEEGARERHNQHWMQFVRSVEQLNEPLLASIVQQAHYKGFDRTTYQVTIHFAQGGIFFKDIIADTQHQWLPILQDIFGQQATLVPTFDTLQPGQRNHPHQVLTAPQAVPSSTPKAPAPKTVMPATKFQSRFNNKSTTRQSIADYGQPLALSEADQWPITHMLLHHFPGQVYELREKR